MTKNELANQSPMSQVQKIEYVNKTFKVGSVVEHLHYMMNEVTKEKITPETVNAACNCVGKLNDTINTAIQASKFLNG